MQKIRSALLSVSIGVLLAFVAIWPALVLKAHAETKLSAVRTAFTIAATYENVLAPINAVQQADFKFGSALTDGAGLNQAQVAILKEDSVAASGTDSWDIAGTITDAYNNVVTCTELKGLAVWNKSTTPGDTLHVVRPATDGAAFLGADGDLVPVAPGGVFIWYAPSAAGVPVAAGDTDNIDIVEAGTVNPVSYQLMVLCSDS